MTAQPPIHSAGDGTGRYGGLRSKRDQLHRARQFVVMAGYPLLDPAARSRRAALGWPRAIACLDAVAHRACAGPTPNATAGRPQAVRGPPSPCTGGDRPGVRMDVSLPTFAHRVTVLGSTRNIVATAGVPVFGICLGSQILGRCAAWAPTSCGLGVAASTRPEQTGLAPGSGHRRGTRPDGGPAHQEAAHAARADPSSTSSSKLHQDPRECGDPARRLLLVSV
jgi:hypothetical protein